MKMKKVSSMLLVIALAITCSLGTCFAGTLPEDTTNTVPVYMNVTGEVSIDFTVSEKIMLTGTADNQLLTATDLAITNNSTMGQIEVKKLEINAIAGWSLKSAELDFANMQANTKQIGFSYGDYDFASGAKVFSADELLVDTKTTENISLVCKVCPTTSSISTTQVATAVITLAIN